MEIENIFIRDLKLDTKSKRTRRLFNVCGLYLYKSTREKKYMFEMICL